ncbi:MAG: hypothetical protein HYU66_12700 [Armatimonadetes bacterium]|nr:hypothetical protein [Armatimonadota bacterium]
MKTAVSIPDDVFQQAERLARQLQTSRSRLYSSALKEFIARHSDEAVTEAINRVVDAIASDDDDAAFVDAVAWHALRPVEW